VLLRRLIQAANQQATVTIGDVTRSVADWLNWKREVLTRHRGFLKRALRHIAAARQKAGVAPERGRDVVVHLDEQALTQEAEKLEQTHGTLTGLLALKNATLTIDVPSDETWLTGREERMEQLLSLGAGLVQAQTRLQFPWSESEELCRLARDPISKISAIKLYREMTGAGLADSKKAVETFASR